MNRAGRFVTFEGGEGAGKTTQIERLAAALRSVGVEVVATREPGGTPGAEAIRQLLVTGPTERWEPLTETLLHLAARCDHVSRRIRPELAAGRWVLCDRFTDSTRVYQGLAGAVGLEIVDRLHQIVLGDLSPDLTLVLDLPVEAGLARRAVSAGEDRYERMGLDFHRRVREGFLTLARTAPERCVVIDASGGIDDVAAAVRSAVTARLNVPLS